MIVIILALYIGYATSNLTTSQLDSAVTGLDSLPGKAVGTWQPCELAVLGAGGWRLGRAGRPGRATMRGAGGPTRSASAGRCSWCADALQPRRSWAPCLTPRRLPARLCTDVEKLQKYGVASATYPWNNQADEQVRAEAGVVRRGGVQAQVARRGPAAAPRLTRRPTCKLAAGTPPLWTQAMVADVKSGALQVGGGGAGAGCRHQAAVQRLRAVRGCTPKLEPYTHIGAPPLISPCSRPLSLPAGPGAGSGEGGWLPPRGMPLPPRPHASALLGAQPGLQDKADSAAGPLPHPAAWHFLLL